MIKKFLALILAWGSLFAALRLGLGSFVTAGVFWLLLRLAASNRLRDLLMREVRAGTPFALRWIFPSLAMTAALGAVQFWGHDAVFSFLKSDIQRTAAVLTGGIAVLVLAAVLVGVLLAPVRYGIARLRNPSAPDPLEILRTLLPEVGLGVWFFLGWSSASIKVPFSFESVRSTVVLAALLILGSCAGLYEDRSPGAALGRWLLAAMFLMTCGREAEALYDSFIGYVLVPSPGHLAVSLILLAGMVWLALAFSLLGVLWGSRILSLDAVALGLLRVVLAVDPQIRVFLWLRHLGHWLDSTWLGRAGHLLQEIAAAFFGRQPMALRLRPLERDRFEVFVRSRLEQIDAKIDRLVPRLRFTGRRSPGGSFPSATSRLGQALSERSKLLLVLCDYQLCPFRKCPVAHSPQRASEMAEWIDRHFQEVRRFEAGGGEGGRDSTNDLLKERLETCWSILVVDGEASSGFGRLVPFRREALAGLEKDDMWRGRWQEQITFWLSDRPDWASFAVRCLLTAHQVAGDMAGLLDAGRRLAMASYELSKKDHLDFGNAWGLYASELPEGPLRIWALERATSHFYQARARMHLEALRNFLEGEQSRAT